MAKKFFFSFVLLAVLLLSTAGLALAEGNEPLGGCPPHFELHNMADHMDHEHHDHHLPKGGVLDRNGDGYVCVKHIGQGGMMFHLHIDNNFPFN